MGVQIYFWHTYLYPIGPRPLYWHPPGRSVSWNVLGFDFFSAIGIFYAGGGDPKPHRPGQGGASM